MINIINTINIIKFSSPMKVKYRLTKYRNGSIKKSFKSEYAEVYSDPVCNFCKCKYKNICRYKSNWFIFKYNNCEELLEKERERRRFCVREVERLQKEIDEAEFNYRAYVSMKRRFTDMKQAAERDVVRHDRNIRALNILRDFDFDEFKKAWKFVKKKKKKKKKIKRKDV